MRMREPSDTQPQLHSVNAGVWCFQSRIRYVHKADVRAPGQFLCEEMQAQRACACEVNAGGAWRHLPICEQSASTQFDIRHHTTVPIEIPDQGKWVECGPIGCIRLLKKHKGRYSVNRILKPSAQ